MTNILTTKACKYQIKTTYGKNDWRDAVDLPLAFDCLDANYICDDKSIKVDRANKEWKCKMINLLPHYKGLQIPNINYIWQIRM